MKHIGIWVLFTFGVTLGALLASILFNTEVNLHFIFGFSFGVGLMQRFNYEMSKSNIGQVT